MATCGYFSTATDKHGGTINKKAHEAGKLSSRATFTGGGRCWVRTSVG
jgi:hypothetical protein